MKIVLSIIGIVLISVLTALLFFCVRLNSELGAQASDRALLRRELATLEGLLNSNKRPEGNAPLVTRQFLTEQLTLLQGAVSEGGSKTVSEIRLSLADGLGKLGPCREKIGAPASDGSESTMASGDSVLGGLRLVSVKGSKQRFELGESEWSRPFSRKDIVSGKVTISRTPGLVAEVVVGGGGVLTRMSGSAETLTVSIDPESDIELDHRASSVRFAMKTPKGFTSDGKPLVIVVRE